jgi:hypothetical protein
VYLSFLIIIPEPVALRGFVCRPTILWVFGSTTTNSSTRPNPPTCYLNGDLTICKLTLILVVGNKLDLAKEGLRKVAGKKRVRYKYKGPESRVIY